MAKNDGVLGIGVNHGRLSLTLMRGDEVRKSVWEEIPDNIVEGNRILSASLFADFLKEKMKENGIKCKKGAYVIADSDIFVRNVTMPQMSDDQLSYNIPFEFRDYISGELKDYVFDYVKREQTSDNETTGTVNLLAYAVPMSKISELRDILRVAGMKLEKAIPETSVYEALIQALGDEEQIKKERCFMDIGRRAIRMMVFKNGVYKLSHVIDIGENHVINAIADDLNVDAHLAMTYLRTKYQDSDRLPAAINAYKDISLEVIKGLNFYEMSDMSARLSDVVLCGTGAMTEPLVEILKERIDKNVMTLNEMLPRYDKDKELNVTYTSVGILLNQGSNMSLAGNLAEASDKKPINIPLLVAGIAAIIVGAVLFAKFAVIDQYTARDKARARVNELQDMINTDMLFIEQSGELADDYYHHTWDDMTEEELGRVSRVEVAQLSDFIAGQGLTVKGLKLDEATFTVNVVGDSLDTMSKLTAALTEQDIVESCSLVNAKKEYIEDDTPLDQANTEDTNNEETTEEENTEEADEEEASDADDSKIMSENSEYIVNAEINIYLKSLIEDKEGAQ